MKYFILGGIYMLDIRGNWKQRNILDPSSHLTYGHEDIPTTCPDQEVWQLIKSNAAIAVSLGVFTPKLDVGQVQRITMSIHDISNSEVLVKLMFNGYSREQQKQIPFMEPDTVDKLKFINKFKRVNFTFAFEVFPEDVLLVDEANMYHIWLPEAGFNFFPFSIANAYYPPKNLNWEKSRSIDNREFAQHCVRTEFGNMLFVYIKTDSYIPWSQKQFFKDQIFGPEIEAIEIIAPEMANKGYECLIMLPFRYTLPVGLGIKKSIWT